MMCSLDSIYQGGIVMNTNNETMATFKALLMSEEKSEVTIYKYLHDVEMFLAVIFIYQFFLLLQLSP